MNRGPERSGPPDAGLVFAHLGDLAQRVSIDTVDELWIFPPRRLGSIDSTVFVVSAFDGGGDRRRIFTAHYVARRDARGMTAVQHALVEHGIAPADRIGRLVEGVLRRLDEALTDAPPHPARIRGEHARWAALLDHFAAAAPPGGGSPVPPGLDDRG